MITAAIQTLLTSSPALAAIVGGRIRVVGPGEAPQVPFLLHGVVETQPAKSHDGLAGFQHNYQVLGYFQLHSQAVQCAGILSGVLEGNHGDFSIVVDRISVEFDAELKLHTLSAEARIFTR
jgi:hypothetical protein